MNGVCNCTPAGLFILIKILPDIFPDALIVFGTLPLNSKTGRPVPVSVIVPVRFRFPKTATVLLWTPPDMSKVIPWCSRSW